MNLTTIPALRIFPPSTLTDGHWLAEDAAAPRRWRIDLPVVVALLAVTSRTLTSEQVVGEIVARTSCREPEARHVVATLADLGLLVDAAGPVPQRQRRFAAIRSSWARLGWAEAADYHAGTFDYPFLDYAAGGRLLDTSRMREYVEAEPDDVRYKSYPSTPVLELPPPSADLAEGRLEDGLSPAPHRALDRESLLSILSLGFGQIDTIPQRKWQRAPMMRRTSPSGGARHPCEAYVVVLDVPGLEPGAYHVHPVGPRLEQLVTGAPTPRQLAAMFPVEFYRIEHGLAAIVVVTCVFSRNMYRYREPRTFRTVHNDAGHLAGTTQLVAGSMGVRSFVEYPDDDAAIEAYLGLDGVTEGFLLTVALTAPDRDADAVPGRLRSVAGGGPHHRDARSARP
jgi:SagB-type dehydrogenase family enzyme